MQRSSSFRGKFVLGQICWDYKICTLGSSNHCTIIFITQIPYQEVIAIAECNPAEDDDENLCYKQGDKIVVIDK